MILRRRKKLVCAAAPKLQKVDLSFVAPVKEKR